MRVKKLYGFNSDSPGVMQDVTTFHEVNESEVSEEPSVKFPPLESPSNLSTSDSVDSKSVVVSLAGDTNTRCSVL